MRFHSVLLLQALWAGLCQAAMQHYPAAWGHYDVCKSQVYSDEGLTWDYMACQPEAADMTQYLKVTLDPPNITCGDPPETYCALVSTRVMKTHTFPHTLLPYAGLRHPHFSVRRFFHSRAPEKLCVHLGRSSCCGEKRLKLFEK